jgi:hypothetical protein
MSILLPQVYTPDEISSLTVEDWLPAGLEALDPNLDNFDGASGGGGGGGGGVPWPWWVCGWWRCSSFTRETHKDRVRYHDRSNRTLNPSPQAAKPQTSHPTHPASSLHPPPPPPPRHEQVRYFAAWAAAGTHTLSYEAIAATRGDFVLPPAKVEAAL